MLRLGSAHGAERNAAVEGDEPAAVLHCKRQQVHIGDLFRPKDSGPIEQSSLGNRNVVRPKLVARLGELQPQLVDRLRCRRPTLIQALNRQMGMLEPGEPLRADCPRRNPLIS